MNKTEHLGVGLIRRTFALLKGKFGIAFIGALVYLAPMALLSLIPYAGWPLAIIAFGYLTEGYISFIKEVLYDKEPKLYTIFKPNENIATVTFLGVILVLFLALGLTLFIIPGVLVILYYSMSLHVIEDEKSQSVMETLKKSASLMNGKKTFMISYKIFYYLAYALSILLFGFLFLLNDVLYGVLPVLSVALLVLLIVFAVIWFAVITTYFVTSNTIFYDTILAEKPAKKAGKAKPEVAEENVVVKPEVKKAPAKKATPAKKTTTTKKTTKK